MVVYFYVISNNESANIINFLKIVQPKNASHSNFVNFETQIVNFETFHPVISTEVDRRSGDLSEAKAFTLVNKSHLKCRV